MHADKKTTIMGGFTRSLYGRDLLDRTIRDSQALKGQHEGVVFDRATAEILAAFRLPQSGLFYEVARWFSFLSRRTVRLFPFAYEEFLVSTAIAAGTHDRGNNPICYLDWDRYKAPPHFDELPWDELPKDTFFYKWVPIDTESEIRKSMFRELPLARKRDA